MGNRPVLVVDDDADNRQLLADVLRAAGYEVRTASDGRDALRHLPHCRPFVILLDLEMPVMDGRSFRAAQQRLDPELARIPVIVCGGSDSLDSAAVELQPFAYMPKPLPDFDPLVQCVEAAYQQAL